MLNTDITYQFYKHVWLRLQFRAIPRINTHCGNLDVISRQKHRLVMYGFVNKIAVLVAIKLSCGITCVWVYVSLADVGNVDTCMRSESCFTRNYFTVGFISHEASNVGLSCIVGVCLN